MGPDPESWGRALGEQADAARFTDIRLGDVQRRARSLRRTRAAVATTGVAALVAAVVLPLSLLSGGTETGTLDPAETPTVSDTANPVSEGPVDQHGFWVVEGEIHPPAGDPFTPDLEGEVASVTWLEDGRWVVGVYPPDRPFEVVITDATGEVLSIHEATDGALASDDTGGAVAWMHPEARPQVLVSGEEQPLDLPVDLSDGRAPAELREVQPGCTPAECVVLVEEYVAGSTDGSIDVAVTLAGERFPLDRLGLLSVTDVSPDGALAAGLTRADEMAFEFCSAVVVLATGEQVWETCDAGSFRFSPDGTMVLGIDPYPDGFAHSFVEVRSRDDGTVVGRYGADAVFDETWGAKGDFLVSQQLDDGTNQLVRVVADGSRQTVLVQEEGSPGDPSPYRLG